MTIEKTNEKVYQNPQGRVITFVPNLMAFQEVTVLKKAEMEEYIRIQKKLATKVQERLILELDEFSTRKKRTTEPKKESPTNDGSLQMGSRIPLSQINSPGTKMGDSVKVRIGETMYKAKKGREYWTIISKVLY